MKSLVENIGSLSAFMETNNITINENKDKSKIKCFK